MHIYLVRKKRKLNVKRSYITIYGMFTTKVKAQNWINNQYIPGHFIIDEVLTDAEVHMEIW